MTGICISIEGMDGAGKSSHIDSLVNLLKHTYKREVVLTREPGGTPLGEKLREILLHDEMDKETEALLMFASRKQHMMDVIYPALKRGDIVVTDRFTDSSFAYQCGGRGIRNRKLKDLEDWVLSGFKPDLTFLFDLPPEVSKQRLAGARTPDKFESQGLEFFTKIRDTYLARAAEDEGRFRIIDSTKDIDGVWAQVKEHMQQFMASM